MKVSNELPSNDTELTGVSSPRPFRLTRLITPPNRAAALHGGDRRFHHLDLRDVVEREVGEVVGAIQPDRLPAAVDGEERLVGVGAMDEDRGELSWHTAWRNRDASETSRSASATLA